MSASEIHQRYLSAEQGLLQSSDNHSHTLTHLIRTNDPISLFEFLASIPRSQLLRLLNSNLEPVGMTPINYAIRCSSSHLILVMLLRSGAVFENGLVSARGDHPLLLAVRAGNTTFVRILLAVNANANVLDGDGYTALHWACFRGNVLVARILLNNADFSYHNHDRNVRKISPLGIAVEMKHAGLVKELCQCPKIDTNIIDSASKRFLYDIAAERGFHFACHQMEESFVSHNRGSIKAFHSQHEYRVHFATQHQIRSVWFTFVDDPRGPFSLPGRESDQQRLKELPFPEEWFVYLTPEMQDNQEGWIQSFQTDVKGRALAVNWNFTEIVRGNVLFNGIDNYRFRHLTRLVAIKK